MKSRIAKKILKRFYALDGDDHIPPHLQRRVFRRAYLRQMNLRNLNSDIRIQHYILIGKEPKAVPFSTHIWHYWKCNNRQIKLTEIDESTFVSTIFLPFDHGFSFLCEGTPPVLFETMARWNHTWDRQVRATTYDQAMKDHEQVLNSLREEMEAIQAGIEEVIK